MIKNQFLILFFALTVSISFSQKNPFEKWSKETLDKANTAKNTDYYTTEEKNIIFYCNLARIDGKLFSETFVPYYLDSTNTKTDSYVTSLISDLKKVKNFPLLQPAKDLYEEAKEHASDMGKTGKQGHNTSTGIPFTKRMSKLAEKYEGEGENCNYACSRGFDVMMDLMIDRGVSNFGHRKNILNEKYLFVGVSIQNHKKWNYNSVMDFGEKRIKKE